MPVLTGKVTNIKTREPVWNAHVIFTDENGKPYSPVIGTVTDLNGNFSFDTLGGYYLRISHVQFENVTLPINLSHYQSGGDYSSRLNISLTPNSYLLPEVTIKGKKTKSAKAGLFFALLGTVILAKIFLKSR